MYLLFAIGILGVGLIILRLGAGPEKAVALVIIGSILLDLVYHSAIGLARDETVDIGHAAIDFLGFTLFLAVGLRANRVWPLLCCAMQLITIFGHISMLIESGAMGAYWLMTAIPPQGEIIVLVAGTIAHVLRQQRIGRYRDWRLN